MDWLGLSYLYFFFVSSLKVGRACSKKFLQELWILGLHFESNQSQIRIIIYIETDPNYTIQNSFYFLLRESPEFCALYWDIGMWGQEDSHIHGYVEWLEKENDLNEN